MQPYVQLPSTTNTSDQIGVALQKTNQNLVFPSLLAGQQTDVGRGFAEYIQPGPPVLRITHNGTGLITLDWSPVAIRFLAEQEAKVSGSNWTPISIPPRTAGNDFTVAIPKTNNTGFFVCISQ